MKHVMDDTQSYPLSTFPCTPTRVGDLMIPLRPGPTPDPAKCVVGPIRHSYTIGVLHTQKIRPPFSIVFRDVTTIHRYVPNAPGTRWISASRDGDLPIDTPWFWLDEPESLTWTQRTEDDTMTGRPAWFADPAPSLACRIVEFVVGNGTYHAEWALTCHDNTCDQEPEFEEFLDFDEAKRVAAAWVRDRTTRRT